MNITISSDLSKDGTTVTVDGKTLKNVHCIDFDMYHYNDMPMIGGPYETKSSYGDHEAKHKFCVCVTTKEEAEDGTEKCLVYRFEKCDDGSVKDSVVDVTPKPEQMAKMIADMMTGNKKNRI